MNFFTQERLREVSEYIQTLTEQDDRSCVIMISARLEFLLRQAIAKRLVAPRSRSKDRIDHLHFAACVSLSYRLGLIHPAHADALDALGKIRNEAAHFDRPVSLSDDRYRALVESFSSPWKADQEQSVFYQMYRNKLSTSTSRERALFIVTASIFFVFWSPLAHITDRLAPLPVLNHIPSTR